MKRFMKKGLALILLAAMVVVLLPENLGGIEFAWAEDEHTHVDENGNKFTAWEYDDRLPTDPGNYYLTKDVDLAHDSPEWTAPKGETRICLNGHSVKEPKFLYKLYVTGNNKLFIYDCADEEECGSIYGRIEVEDTASVTVNGGWIYDKDNFGIKIPEGSSGTVTVNGGIIGDEETYCGIRCESGSNGLLTINGGKIQGGTDASLLLWGGTAKMTGGIITDIESEDSVIVSISDEAQFEMSGGTIWATGTETVAIDNDGNVSISGGTIESEDCNVIGNCGTLEVSGGTIGDLNLTRTAIYNYEYEYEDNEGNTETFTGTTTVKGGSVLSRSDGIVNEAVLEVWDGTIESSNYAGLYNDVSGTLTVTGGTIHGATYGVYNEGAFKLSGKPEIKGNTGDIYLSKGKYVTINGALTGTYRIGMQTVGVFTNTADENKELNKESCFTAAKPRHRGYAVRKNADDQLELFYAPETYTISYNPGRYGEGEINSDSRGEGAAPISLSSETFTRKCYTQTGWATEDGGEKAYDLGGEYAEDANITLYPYWGDAEHTFATDTAVEPTCTGTGLTEGSHCSVCGTILVEQETVAALGHDPDDTWHTDEKEHYHICQRSGCGEKVNAADHTSGDWIVDREATTAAEGSRHKECTVCGEVLETETIPKKEDVNAGRVDKDVRSDENAPEASLPMDEDELADAVLDEDEKQAVENGTDIRIILNVKDASESVSAATKQMVEAAIEAAPKAYIIGQYLDVSLLKLISDGSGTMTEGVETTNKPILITITIPENMKGDGNRTFAILRVHGGETDILEDLDTDPDTITIETDRFSTYVLIYQEEKTAEDTQKAQDGNGSSSQTDGRGGNGQNGNTAAAVKTGDMSHVEIYATLAMIAGLTCFVLYLKRRERGVREE